MIKKFATLLLINVLFITTKTSDSEEEFICPPAPKLTPKKYIPLIERSFSDELNTTKYNSLESFQTIKNFNSPEDNNPEYLISTVELKDYQAHEPKKEYTQSSLSLGEKIDKAKKYTEDRKLSFLSLLKRKEKTKQIKKKEKNKTAKDTSIEYLMNQLKI